MSSALDTFRTAPYRHNCAQAIAFKWRNLFESADVVEQYAPYVGGRAPQGYCGALYAAQQALPEMADAIEREFRAACGSAYCHEIKQLAHTPCETCVTTADRLVEAYSGKK